MSFWSHLWSAQRRHGVHSPFVYAYGDQVLRKNHYSFLDAMFAQKWHKKTESMIEDLLNFCGAEQVLRDGEMINIKSNNLKTDFPLMPIPQVSIFTQDFTASTIDDGAMYIVYRNNKMTQNLQSIYKSTSKPLMLLDLYFFQVLINHEMFKNKQHYQLK